MKILHLIESLEFGGAEKVVVHLANKMCEIHEIHVCTTKRQGELADQLDNRIKQHHLGLGEGNSLNAPLKIRALLKKEGIELLHIHNWSVYIEGVLATLGRAETSVVQTVHGPYMHYAAGLLPYIKKQVRHKIEKLLCPRVCKIISVSQAIKDYIHNDRGIPVAKILTIHNGIADKSQESISQMEDDSKTHFITVGRLAPIKNHEFMLKAFSLAFGERVDVSLTIVGDGEELENLKFVCQLKKIDDRVEFLGFRTDVHQLLARHDVFLLTSHYEGISIAMLEAMSLSMPAIVTNVGGLPEMIKDGETGLLVSDGDMQAFAHAMRELANSKQDIRRMGQNARRYYLSDFHEEIAIAKYDALYTCCCNG